MMQLKSIKVTGVHSEITSVEASACIKRPNPHEVSARSNVQGFRNCFVSYCVS